MSNTLPKCISKSINIFFQSRYNPILNWKIRQRRFSIPERLGKTRTYQSETILRRYNSTSNIQRSICELLNFSAKLPVNCISLLDSLGALYFPIFQYPLMFPGMPNAVAERIRKVNDAFNLLSTFLGDNDYMTGNKYTVADFNLVSTTTSFEVNFVLIFRESLGSWFEFWSILSNNKYCVMFCHFRLPIST